MQASRLRRGSEEGCPVGLDGWQTACEGDNVSEALGRLVFDGLVEALYIVDGKGGAVRLEAAGPDDAPRREARVALATQQRRQRVGEAVVSKGTSGEYFDKQRFVRLQEKRQQCQ